MAEARIDVRLIDEIALPYELGAEQFLDAFLRPFWDEFVALFPGLRLDPLFFSVDLMALLNMLDAARIAGEEPPNLLNWFEIPCDVELLETILPLVQALPFIAWAGIRPDAYVSGFISHGTNPETPNATHLKPARLGVDAIYAWRVPGGTGRGARLVDIEHAWNLAHEDLAQAGITAASVYPGVETQDFINHGTAVLGIALGQDNGLGMVGVSPEATGLLVSATRADGRQNPADAIIAAGIAAQPGGVVLLELASNYYDPPGPHIFMEVHPPIQAAMSAVAAFGITVIEPAGNGGVNLDYIDGYKNGESRAVVVGGAYMKTTPTDIYWSRTPPDPSWGQSAYGQRVDCFAPFKNIHAPTGKSFNGYEPFGGTSGASAIIAGVACAMQGMAMASRWRIPFWPTELRRALRDPTLGTAIAPGEPGDVGAMPDLRKIARYYNLAAIRPVAAAILPDHTVAMAALDPDDWITRTDWRAGGQPGFLPGRFAGRSSFLEQQTPAIAAVTRPVEESGATFIDIAAVGSLGTMHHQGWEGQAPISSFNDAALPANTFARGHDLAIGRSLFDQVVITGISPEGQLIATSATISTLGNSPFALPSVVAPGLTFRRTPGPRLLFREMTVPTLSDRPEIVAIDDDGHFHWAVGEQPLGSDYSWFEFDGSPIGAFEPGAKPGMAIFSGGTAFAAIGEDRNLHIGIFSLDIDQLGPLPAQTSFAATGPVGLAKTGENTLVVAAVGTDGLIYSATRPLTIDGVWTPLAPIDSREVSTLGGVAIATAGSLVSILAVRLDGRPCRYDRLAGPAWKPYD